MAFRDTMIEWFDTGDGVIGYRDDGRFYMDWDRPIDPGDAPVMTVISLVQNPTSVAAAVAAAEAGKLTAPAEAHGELGDLVVTRDGVRAELDMPNNSYEQQLTFAEFAPILAAWQAAWNGAQAHIARRRAPLIRGES